MDNSKKFALPSPNFHKKMESPLTVRPHFLTPSGMTLHARHQPPPMYGKRGPTYPSKYLQTENKNKFVKVEAAQTEAVEPEYCEACDMELQSNDDLRRHKLQHEKCPVDNCNYRGHPSVMDKHVATLHSSGLFDKFKKLSSPEEIAAWREERKRKYPTLENSLMRQRAKEQREKRGERLEAHNGRFGKQEDRKRAQTNHCSETNKRNHNQQQKLKGQNGIEKRNRNKNKRRKKEEVKKLDEKKQNDVIANIKSAKTALVEENIQENDISCNDIIMFKGTSKLANYNHVKPKKPKETNVLSSLLGMYGSDEDSENDYSNNEMDDKDTDNLIDDKLNETICTDTCASDNGLSINPLENSTHLPPVSSLNVEKVEDTESGNIAEVHCNKSLENVDIVNNPDTSEAITIATEKNENVSDNSVDTVQSLNPQNADLVCSDDEAPEEAPIARSSDLPISTKSSQPSVRRNDGASNDNNQQPTNRIKKADPVARINKQQSGLDYRKARLRKQNTLLEKLLEPDIRHERNVLLQCVRYVCENNFFGIGEKKIEN
ncbi:nuclear fragile X mental retardation-interacting protein 1 [Bactrocera dorsalis]|uniref:Nuclear fragile X mental retardation-interacting protein 1 n=1 Tax=Bactrocera dorsalis TaxID=27457 RepID=A0A6J0RIW7_BACDO|nr:nuclear fragile X mental retardation-interacting protein 1 [Bactrocera dorsalis]